MILQDGLTTRSVFEIDQYFVQLLQQANEADASAGVVPYALSGELTELPDFDHAFAGVLLYFVEDGTFLLQQRDHLARSNPDRTCIFGGRVKSGELPSAAALRELGEETGIDVALTQLLPLRSYIERRLAAPVFRAIYVVLLDRKPLRMRIGEGAGMLEVRATLVNGLETVTPLSHEDIALFIDKWYPLSAA